MNTQIKRQISGTTNRDKIEIEINRDKIFRDTSAMHMFQYIDYISFTWTRSMEKL